jgi:hypothetical protein
MKIMTAEQDQTQPAFQCPCSLFVNSAIISFILCVFSTVYPQRFTFKETFAYFFIAPELFQLIAFLGLLILVLIHYYRFLSSKKEGHASVKESPLKAYGWKLVRAFILVLALFIFCTLVQEPLGAIAFGNSQSSSLVFDSPTTQSLKHLRHSVLALIVSSIFPEASFPMESSVPSGFTLRQWIITLMALFLIRQPLLGLSRKQRYVLFGAFILICLYVCANRIFTGAHSPLDVGIAFPLGTIVFTVTVFTISAIKQIQIPKTQWDFFASFSVASMLIFAVISFNPMFWIFGAMVFMLFLSFLYRNLYRVEQKKI